MKDYKDEFDLDEEFDNDDYCYECGGYGDDYYYDEELGEIVCACDDCPFNPLNNDYDY